MNKTLSLVDKERGIVQVTTDDERFYIKEDVDPETGNPCHVWLPSSTWIAGYTPKGIGFYKWLADKGWDEAEAIKADRGKYGTRVHRAIELLLTGNDITMNEELTNPETGQLETMTAEEYWAVMTFVKWWTELNEKHTVEVVTTEYTIWCKELGFAGTVDCVLKVDGAFWIIDFKTSQNTHLSHAAQISSYKHGLLADPDMDVGTDPRLFILQIGYRRTQKAYKLTEIEDCFHLWQAGKQFWADEHQGKKPTKPRQVNMPIKLSLGVKKNMSKQKVSHAKTTKTTTKRSGAKVQKG